MPPLHGFSVGQGLGFVPGPRDGNVPRGPVSATRPLPGSMHDREYGMEYHQDGHERVVLKR